MPGWAQAVLGIAAIVTALSVIWSKVLRPGIRAASAAEVMLPLLVELTTVFRNNPDGFKTLNQIASQFRADSGTSLRDVVNRLEAAAIENARAAEILRVGVEAGRLLSERDRQQVQYLLTLLDRLTVKVEALSASGERIEADRTQVAQDLRERIQEVDRATAGVAKDLADSHERADAVTGDPGTAADAASRSTPDDAAGRLEAEGGER